MLGKEHKEALHMAAKCQDDLKEAGENVKCRDASILEVEKVKNHVQSEKDRAWADLEKAMCELERAVLSSIQERDFLKV